MLIWTYTERNRNAPIDYRLLRHLYFHSLHYEKFPDGSVKCIEDEIPFELPQGWKWARISTVCLVNPRNALDDSLQVSFIPMPLIQEGFANNHTAEIKEWSKVKSGFTHFAEGDIAVAKITPCFENRKSVIFSSLRNGYGAGTTELHILRTINISSEYILWIVKSEDFISKGVQAFTGAVGQQRVGKEYISNYIIPIPPLAEQKCIVDKINEIFDFISSIETNKTTLQDLIKHTKSKILDLAIRGKLVPQNPDDEPASVLLDRIRAEKEELIKQGKIKRDKKESVIYKDDDNSYYGDIPDSWKVASISQLNFYQSSSVNPLLFPDECFELYSVPNYDIGVPEIVKGMEIGSTKQSVGNKDVLLCKINPRINRVWTVNCVTEYKTIASSEWIVFRNPILYSPYINIYLSSPLFRELLLTNVSGVGGSLMRAQLDSVKKYPVAIPPYEEQKRIADKVSQLFSLLDSIAENVN